MPRMRLLSFWDVVLCAAAVGFGAGCWQKHKDVQSQRPPWTSAATLLRVRCGPLLMVSKLERSRIASCQRLCRWKSRASAKRSTFQGAAKVETEKAFTAPRQVRAIQFQRCSSEFSDLIFAIRRPQAHLKGVARGLKGLNLQRPEPSG